MKTYKYFVFDLDGTLVDSSPSIYASIRNMEKMLGLVPLTQEQMQRFVGPPLAESFIKYYDITEAEIPNMLAVYRKDYNEHTSAMSMNYPGVTELLEYIGAAGCKAAVATLKNRSAAEVSLSQMGLTKYFDIVAAMEDGKPGTKCSLILDCLEYYGNPSKEEVVFFGDSPYDGVGAKEAGVDFVALTYGFGFLEPGSLEGIPSVYKATEPMELVEFVKSSAKWE